MRNERERSQKQPRRIIAGILREVAGETQLAVQTPEMGEFKQLDALHDRLGAAIAARRKSQPPRVSEDDERLANAAIDDAREVLLRGLAPKLQGTAFDAAVGQLGQSIASFKAWCAANPSSPWAAITLPSPLETFQQVAQAPRPSGAQRLESQTVYQLVNGFVLLVEARQRAIARAALVEAKGSTP